MTGGILSTVRSKSGGDLPRSTSVPHLQVSGVLAPRLAYDA
jgi:hypothetical protein